MADDRYVEKDSYEERVLNIKRVSKKTKGGNKIGFTALVVVGNKSGSVGAGLGKAVDVRSAISKGISLARKDLQDVPLKNSTIPHEVQTKYRGSMILIKPAPEGSGIIAGGVIRHVMELAGINDVSAKMLGSSNKLNNVKCTLVALNKLKGKTNGTK